MKFLLFLGTVRDSTPPKPARLGVRVAEAPPELNELAAKEYRAQVDPYKLVRAFKTDPSERNAP
ncbi:hypothetical protein [Marinobacter vulgaris]|uniref:hypothetical protein n=1 Tax=Marinobacter vulgaris TaxID=1928331 RepID=UPI001D0D8636|nr:hypothetical protein [Marinobacter vulgaris]